jgi:glyoxylase-like metal-dependent hydrolase (beta-lactamase superfamily II)
VLRIHRAAVNCYLVVSPDGLTLIDAGLPGTWRVLEDALRSLGATTSDISAVVLTHGHFDHVGLCARLEREHGVPVHVHVADRPLVRHPYRYEHEKPRWPYPLRYPGALPILGSMVAAGALGVKGSVAEGDVRPGAPLDVPGRPVPIPTPGHTAGHCAYLLPDRGILFTGDALVTLDPYTGREGPRIVARAATADVAANLVSLSALGETGAGLVLPGHGAPFAGGIREAVMLACGRPVA